MPDRFRIPRKISIAPTASSSDRPSRGGHAAGLAWLPPDDGFGEAGGPASGSPLVRSAGPTMLIAAVQPAIRLGSLAKRNRLYPSRILIARASSFTDTSRLAEAPMWI